MKLSDNLITILAGALPAPFSDFAAPIARLSGLSAPLLILLCASNVGQPTHRVSGQYVSGTGPRWANEFRGNSYRSAVDSQIPIGREHLPPRHAVLLVLCFAAKAAKRLR